MKMAGGRFLLGAVVACLSPAICLLQGCRSENADSLDRLDPADSTLIVTLNHEETLCLDCILMKRIVTLGDTAGEGFVNYSRDVIRDSLGRYWVGEDGHIKVFDGNGKYVGEVGRQGQGPMEFSRPQPMLTAPNGDVRVFDAENHRETVINSRFERVTATRLAIGANFNYAAPLPEPHRYVVSMWRATTEGIGLPLHVISGDSVIASFGSDSSAGTLQNLFTSVRELATDNLGRIYSASQFDYHIDVWAAIGRRITGFEGPVLNEHEVKPGAYNLDDNPIANEIRGLQVDQAGRLWVLILQVRPNWRNYYERTLFPNGEPGMELKEGYTADSVYMSRVDVIDLHAGKLIARLNRSGLLIDFVGPGIVFQNILLPSGVRRFVIWEIGLDEPKE